MYTCIHVYMYTCIHVYMYMYMHMYMYMYMYMYIQYNHMNNLYLQTATSDVSVSPSHGVGTFQDLILDSKKRLPRPPNVSYMIQCLTSNWKCEILNFDIFYIKRIPLKSCNHISYFSFEFVYLWVVQG